MQHPPKYKLRFFFDYGAGGCLWANDDNTLNTFGLGPIDYSIAEKTHRISKALLTTIEELDLKHAGFLNKQYPLDPSLWTQQECDEFNIAIDKLLVQLRTQLSDFEILDQQERYTQDPDLHRYLADPWKFKRDISL